MGQFHGVVPAIISPKNEDGTLNEEAFRATMEFNIQAGVHGFWVAGGTGESVLLDDEENQRIAEISADQNAGRTQVIMHVGPILRRGPRNWRLMQRKLEWKLSARCRPFSIKATTMAW